MRNAKVGTYTWKVVIDETFGPKVSVEPDDPSIGLLIRIHGDNAEIINKSAHLIAAAPDMYRALEIAISQFKDDAHLRRFPALFAMMENAIKKARSEK